MHILCQIIDIPGDGACLFSSLSYLVHGNISMATEIRADIVRHVSNEWHRFKCFTMNRSGAPYGTKRLYVAEMSQPYTYGTTSELKAAGEIFPFEFQVFQDGILLATFGEALQGIKRIRFTGNYYEGHFDVLIPLHDLTNPDDIVNVQHSSTTHVAAESEPNLSSTVTGSQLTPSTVFLSSYESDYPTQAVVKDPKGKKRRKRFSDAIRKKQVKEAVTKYTQHHPEVNRQAVTKYTQNHPEVNRKAVKKYSHNNPHVNQAASAKYNDNRSDIKLTPWKKKSFAGFDYNSKIDYAKDKIVDLGPRLPCI